jgi:transposase
MNATVVGLDLAKNVFQVHGVDAHGQAVLCRKLSRSQVAGFFARLSPCVIGMEACGSAHHWARQLSRLGHTVRLMPAQFVRPYRKSEKNDANDAEAICEAVTRPTMRFVAMKSVEQQATLMVHRIRQLLVQQRTALANQTRALLAEFGIVVPVGFKRLRRQLPEVLEDGDNAVPMSARSLFAELYDRLGDLCRRIEDADRRIEAMAQVNASARRLLDVDGIGVLTATAVVATTGDAKQFKNGRQFAAWLGLVPRQHSSGGKQRLGHITKRGNAYLRTLLIHGARSTLRFAGNRTDRVSQWALAIKARRGHNTAIVALAAKLARILWAMLARQSVYQPSMI